MTLELLDGLEVLILTILSVFWIWMLIHAITNNGLSGIARLVWVVVIVLTQFLGALLYFLIGRPKRRLATQQ